MTPRALKKRGCRYWRNLFLVGLAGLFVGLLLVVYIAFPIIHANGVAHPGRSPVCCITPADQCLDYEDVSFITADGLTLRGWYIPSQNGAAVIVVHGVASNRLSHLDQAVALARHGYGVLPFDLRAHGESDGDTITFGGQDILAAVTYLQGRDDVAPDRIGAMGLSLGGLAVVQAAANSEAVKAVVADGPGPNVFQDMPQPKSLKDWLWVPFDWAWFKALERQGVPAPLSAVEAIAKIAPRPLLLISGAGSRHERRAMRKYFAAAGEPKALWEIPETGHGGAWGARPAEYEERIVAFFDQALLAEGNTD
jgi:predicted acyl esterase